MSIANRIFQIFLICSMTLSAQYEWVWQEPTPVGNYFYDVQRLDATTLVACGSDAGVLKSTDSGATWSVIHDARDGKADDMESVCFVNATTGWTAGGGPNLLKTSDGGNTWVHQEVDYFANVQAVYFLDELRGWAGGSGRVIYYTENGGDTWNSAPVTQSNFITDIHFADENSGWAVANLGVLYYSSDGGLTWNEQVSGTTATLKRLDFFDADTGWAVGASGTLLKTINAGGTWVAQTTNTNALLNDVEFFDAFTGLAVGQGVILKSVDGGASWTQTGAFGEDMLDGVSYLDESTIAVSGQSGTILISTDGGENWQPYGTRVADYWLTKIEFTDESNGWAGGIEGGVLRTTDGGENWEKVLQMRWGVDDIETLDNETAYLLSWQKELFFTDNGGISWDTLEVGEVSGTTPYMSFPSVSVGYVTGTYGGTPLVKTVDGGVSWTAIDPGASAAFFRDVFFIDEDTGWLGGIDGVVLSTTDGGDNWTEHNVGVTEDVTQIYFEDANRGWAIAGRHLLKTSNGGASWTNLNPFGQPNFVRFEIAENSVIWASAISGLDNQVLYSVDGGVTWFEEALPLNSLVSDLAFTDRNKGWVCTGQGFIFHRIAETVSIDEPVLEGPAASFELQANYPNPFNPATHIRFSIESSHNTSLIIYNLLGQTVATLLDRKMTPGQYEVIWDGRNKHGQMVASGVYLYRLQAGKFQQTRRMVLMR